MVAYEFSTAITDERTLVIPEDYAKTLPIGEPVRVILLVNGNGYQNGHHEAPSNENLSLEELVAEIKQMPSNPANIKPASGLLGKHLAELEQKFDPTFDIVDWLSEWDRVEAEMKKASLTHETNELEELQK